MIQFKETIEVKKNICLLGDSMVGKTSLINRFVDDKFYESLERTFGVGLKKKDILYVDRGKLGENVLLKFMIYDLVGDPDLQRTLGMAFSYSHGALVVTDITNKESLISAKERWVKKFFEYKKMALPIVLIVNKYDLKDQAQFGTDEMEDVANNIRDDFGLEEVPYVLTSAKENISVEKAFRDIGEIFLKKMDI